MTTTPQRLTVLTMLALLLTAGCGYGTVSPKTYQLATAIYGVCNRQQTEKLPELDQLIRESLDADEISAQEAGWLNDILENAQQGQWETASRQARQLMEDQVQ